MTDNEQFDLVAEKAVMGAILAMPTLLLDVQEIMERVDVYAAKHGFIYSAMISLSEQRKPIDVLTVSDELSRQDKLEEIGGLPYLNELYLTVPQEKNALAYAQIVARKGFNRRLAIAASTILQMAQSDDELTPDEKRAQAEKAIFDVCQKSSLGELIPIEDIVSMIYDQTAQRAKDGIPIGVPFGFSSLDTLLDGMQKQEYVIVAGRPGMGKSSLMWCMALNQAMKHGVSCAFFSLEMSNEQLIRRALAMKSTIDSKRIQLGKLHDGEWSFFIEASEKVSSASIFMDDTPAIGVSQIRHKARRLMMKHELDIIYIDYFQLMQSGRRYANPVQEFTRISIDIKALAKELDMPVVVGSQLSRACEQRSDKRPMLSDLRETGSLEQDADKVIFIYRDDYYNPETETPNIAEINTEKNRNGPTGSRELFFRKQFTEFVDVELTREELN